MIINAKRQALILSLHQAAPTLVRGLVWVLRLLNLPYQRLECLADVLVVSCASLGPPAVEFLCDPLAVLRTDLPLLWAQVALVSHDDDGNPLDSLKSTDRVSSDGHALSEVEKENGSTTYQVV